MLERREADQQLVGEDADRPNVNLWRGLGFGLGLGGSAKEKGKPEAWEQ